MRNLLILAVAVSAVCMGCGASEDQTNVDAAPKTANANPDVKPNLNKNMPGAAGGPSSMNSTPLTAPGK